MSRSIGLRTKHLNCALPLSATPCYSVLCYMKRLFTSSRVIVDPSSTICIRDRDSVKVTACVVEVNIGAMLSACNRFQISSSRVSWITNSFKYALPIRHHSTLQLYVYCKTYWASCDDAVLRPGDAIWRHRSMSTLAQIMACCLTAPSHYLNQCWLMISEVLWHSPDTNFTENT